MKRIFEIARANFEKILFTVFPRIVSAETILFLEVEVRQLFKGGNFSREETIVFLLFRLYDDT